MDLVKLGEDFRATELVQGERSLIWTERYAEAGDFQLQTLKVEDTRAQIPEGTYVGLMDSAEVMIVEEHDVDADPETGADLLTVKGRTFEVLGEQRTTYRLTSTGGASVVSKPYDLDDIETSWIVTTMYSDRLSGSEFVNPDARNRVPNYIGMELDTDYEIRIPTEELVDYRAPMSDIYGPCLAYAKSIGAGIRNRRFLTGILQGQLRSEFYAGADRTVNQEVRPPVIFTTMQDHLLDARYLWTLRNYKNLASVISPIYQGLFWAPGVDPASVGKNVRTLHVDANDITSAGSSSPAKLVKQRALAELAKHNQIFFFEGEISPASPYKRGLTEPEGFPTWHEENQRRIPLGDYDLGDLVTLMGKYGVSQTMRVTEFVRTQDETGYREFPTLSQPILEES